MKLLKLAVMASLALGGALAAAEPKPDATLEVGVHGGMLESGTEGAEKKFKEALTVNGGAQNAKMTVNAEKEPIIDIATMGQGNNTQWTPGKNVPSAQSPQKTVTQSATFPKVEDGGYKQKTEGLVQTKDGGTGENRFNFDSSIDTEKSKLLLGLKNFQILHLKIPIC